MVSVKLAEGLTKLSAKLQNHSIRYAMCTPLWQNTATAYGQKGDKWGRKTACILPSFKQEQTAYADLQINTRHAFL